MIFNMLSPVKNHKGIIFDIFHFQSEHLSYKKHTKPLLIYPFLSQCCKTGMKGKLGKLIESSLKETRRTGCWSFFLVRIYLHSLLFSLNFQFVCAVEEMEQAILVPQSLQDMSLSNNNNGLVLDKSLYEAFTGLKNIKNVILTGK